MTNAAQFALAHGPALLFTWILLQQAGVPIPGAPLLIAAGSLASSRRLGLASSLLATLSACLLADGFWYRVGRRGGYKGARFRRTSSHWKDRALSLIRGHSAVSLLLAKFIAGSNWASLLAGQAGISAARFVIYDSIGSLTWSGGYFALGYLLHGQLHWTLAQALRPLFIVRVAVSLARLWRRRSLAYAMLALAIVFFAARPVSQHNAGMRMSADAWQNVRPTGSARPAWVWLHRDALGWEESAKGYDGLHNSGERRGYEESRGGGFRSEGSEANHGYAESHAQSGMHSSAFGGYDHGGTTRNYSDRGYSSMHGGGFHEGGFHAGGFGGRR